ncbi:glycosyltransferase family 2 protein [Belliella sp. DSM 111904]|uniref:Glycosyltransferase family 2 protein n=1 Tax=Belliella filtrata TaxID=2923435 RepID=A0ABS9UY54_9BACT|nr:glycosyltransferase family 2 protein [Belliella filtrata]MCH7409079.1 glycosyltransferase family 2 protein [Belliella filtrata]
MIASVIISTYNSPLWLEKVLIGFLCQSHKDFEIIIADDGSTVDTANLLDKYKTNFKSLIHVWHPDDGFRKCEILNKAIEASTTSYLIFTDGDCIPRNDFINTHLKYRDEGKFLSGGYFKLPLSISNIISTEIIQKQLCFDIEWLANNGLESTFKNTKLSNSKTLTSILNAITTTKPSWNGHNASGWKKDILAVNGFDERMKYGGEDRELGERLENYGITGLQIRYKAVCVHLDHERSYIKEEDLIQNKAIRKETKKNKATFTPYGIKK